MTQNNNSTTDIDRYWKFRAQNLPQSGFQNYVPVDAVEVKILDACNRACTFCVNEDYSGKQVNLFDSTLFLHSLFDWVDDPYEAEKPAALYLTGGEPLIALDEVEKIVRPVAERQIATRLVTNGTLLNKQRVSRLAEMGLTGVKVTYTSTESERLFKIVKGSHREDPQRLLDGIRRAKDAGLWTFVRIGIGRHNYDEVVKIYQLMRDIGVDVIQMKPWIASGLAAINSDELLLNPEELLTLFSQTAEAIGIEALQATKPELTVSCYPPARSFGYTVKDCANISKIYCEPSGNALICNFADEYLGSWRPEDGGLGAVVRRRREIYQQTIDEHGVASCPARFNWSEPQAVVSPVPTDWKKRKEGDINELPAGTNT
ncbi:radical SAM protein [Lysinibacillus sp. NPDC097231]|uniref:radical SAM protein n=1 Tax=Lysinibacillus sp. NPDC097231 TaxID=3364142 RepID=UPI0037FE6C9D